MFTKKNILTVSITLFLLILQSHFAPSFAQNQIFGLTAHGGDNYDNTPLSSPPFYTEGAGTIFSIDADGNFHTKLHNFGDINDQYANQFRPIGGLTAYQNALYGTANQLYDDGVLFKYENGGYSVVAQMNCVPYSNLVLYGKSLYCVASGSYGTTKGVYEYNLENNTSVIHTQIPEYLSLSAGKLVVHNGKIYGVGTNGKAIIYEFDPITKSTISKIPLNSALSYVTNPSITKFRKNDGTITHYITVENYLYQLDLDQGSYDIKANMTTYNFSSFSTDAVLAVFGTKLYGIKKHQAGESRIYAYDPYNNTVSVFPHIVAGLGGVGCGGFIVSPNNKLYVMIQNAGSYNPYSPPTGGNLGGLYEFDPINNTYQIKVDFNGENGAFPGINWLTTKPAKEIQVIAKGIGVTDWQDIDDEDITPREEDNTDFGWTEDEGQVLDRTFVIKNVGFGTLTLQSPITITGVDAGDFQVLTAINYPYTLSSNQELAVTIRFNPIGVSTVDKFAQVNIYSDDADENPHNFVITSRNPKKLLWGMTFGGGKISHEGYQSGTIFSTDMSGNNFKVRYSFKDDETEAGYPYGHLIHHRGIFYGMCSRGGPGEGVGSIFKYNPSTNEMEILYSFNNPMVDGELPIGSLVLHQGKLYGMTNVSGGNEGGVLFRYDLTSNTYTTLYAFDAITGINPRGKLLVMDGYLYGMTNESVSWMGGGSLFRYSITNQTMEVLHTFQTNLNNSPYYGYGGELLQLDNVLYGVHPTENGKGILFSYNVANGFQTMAVFDGANGAYPTGGLTRVRRILYGMASAGGDYDKGTLFAYKIGGNSIDVLEHFDGEAKGANPYGSLYSSTGEFLNANTTLYGVTYVGGIHDRGVIFKRPLAGGFTKTHDFELGVDDNGALPVYMRLIKGFLLIDEPPRPAPKTHATNSGVSTQDFGQYTIYPNPAKEHITIDLGTLEQPAPATLFDAQGKAVWTQELKTPVSQVRLPNLKKGVYVLQVTVKNTIQTRRIVIE